MARHQQKRRRRKKRERDLEGVNLLDLAPVRLAEWEEAEGRVVLLRPRPEAGGVGGFFDRIFHSLSAQRVRLDEVGSHAWRLMDGERTVAEVGGLLAQEFQDRVKPVEERLGRLVWMLRREGFLAYPGWDDEDG